MLIKEIMTEKVLSVGSQTKITEVAKILHEYKIHGLPVVDGDKLVGIITETDFFTKDENDIYLPFYVEFLKNVSSEESSSEKNKETVAKLIDSKAEDIMTRDCITIFPDDDVKTMFKLVKEANLHTVPVVSQSGKLVGIVTVADIIKLI